MANPKDTGLSAAFRDRADHEQQRLEARLAKHLQEDMARLLEDGLHADLTLVLPGGVHMAVHTAIIKHRAPAFYNKYIMATGASVTLETDDLPGLQVFIRSVYTDDHVAPSPWNDVSTQSCPLTADHGDALTSPVGAVTSVAEVDSNGNGRHQGEAADGQAEPSHADKAGGDAGLRTGCCPLGTSLLTMFYQGSGADVIFTASGQRFSAHRCILCARSSYFSAMLSGGWRESSTQQIALERVSAGVVHQALLFVYGAPVQLSPACSLGELVVVGDMYGISDMKHMAAFLLRRDYCHFFHKPCSGCLAGVCETLPLTFNFGLDDLQERCLRWAARHFVRLWPTKQFALLPQDILEKCFNQIVNDITPTTVVDVVLEADCLTSATPNVRWAHPIITMTTRLTDTCIAHLGTHLVDVMATERFLSMATTMALGLDLLLGVMRRALAVMPVEHACQTYIRCEDLAQRTHEEDCAWSEDFRSLVRAVRAQCEQFMHQYVHLIVGTTGWKLLSPNEQAKVKDGGYFVVPEEAKKPHHKKAAAGSASRPTKLPSQHRARGGRPGGGSATPSPAGGSRSGGHTPHTPTTTSRGSAPTKPGQTKPSASTPGTSTTGASMQGTSSTLQMSTRLSTPNSSTAQSSASSEVSNGAVARPSGTDQPIAAMAPSVTSPLEPKMKQPQGACSEAKLQKMNKDLTLEKAQPVGKVAAGTAGKVKGSSSDSHRGVALRKADGSGTDAKPRPGSSLPTRKAGGVRESARQRASPAPACRLTGDRGTSASSLPTRETGASSHHRSVPSTSTANPRCATSTAPSQAQPAPACTGSTINIGRASSGAQTQPANKPSAPRQIQKHQVKHAKVPVNLAQVHMVPAPLQQQQKQQQKKATAKGDARKETGADARPRSSHSRKAKPKPSPTTLGKGDYRSRSSSGSSQVSSPRSAVSTRLPVTSKIGTRRYPGESVTKENDAVFAKCTSMRIAAMKNQRQVDVDLDYETESVISLLSHVAVKGSRTPSIADFDLSPNEFSPEDLYNGTNAPHPAHRPDGGRLAATCEEVALPAPEEHNDVIVPVFDAIFTEPTNETKDG